MSRRIDISNPEELSDEDREYLQQRGRNNLVNHLDYVARIEAAKQNRTETKAVRQPREVVETEEVDEPYSEWSVADLKEECRNRKLPVSGTQEELVARLEAFDQNSD